MQQKSVCHHGYAKFQPTRVKLATMSSFGLSTAHRTGIMVNIVFRPATLRRDGGAHLDGQSNFGRSPAL
jgi:hypothetical protein